ncbi:hypothetical protein [Lacticaseibacillus thailandensis]|uniref:Immunity protein n=1 Tax=Lacticaseibacillus thailandensis DSM 22698 = JCM 13996 TaxID=1423810 RepID=A0A0R2C4B0_9LACO|nr:hypothetical protein [Lacticaseibacillus thailandensis]KRM86557.1 hypothetical protein FD19_GL001870 [Lacticaseibacillus thailandensis DSM 22698 = JCM 13996]
MWEQITGLVVLLGAVWQFWITRQTFRGVRDHGNAGTSPFIGFGLWYSVVFGVLLLGVGIALVLRLF